MHAGRKAIETMGWSMDKSMSKITCQQCAYSQGRWMDEFTRAILICTKDNKEAPEAICSRFEREPGTMERETNS
jgi:hypothetical protein